jgi:hypothetical protein
MLDWGTFWLHAVAEGKFTSNIERKEGIGYCAWIRFPWVPCSIDTHIELDSTLGQSWWVAQQETAKTVCVAYELPY